MGLYAHHRVSFDHDHVLTDLVSRYDTVLQAMEDTEGWVLAQRYSRPPVTIMGSLDGVEAGLRQLRRARPLEVEEVALGDGRTVTVPTLRRDAPDQSVAGAATTIRPRLPRRGGAH
ncbi:hypothetical protein QP028_07015 [Corynebacterium suedekumii]|nr:hypothetical protein QP028_07015 [Corynebacterium suedekumii]